MFLIDYSLQKSHRPLQNTLYSHKNDYKRTFFSPWPTWERVADLRSPQHFHVISSNKDILPHNYPRGFVCCYLMIRLRAHFCSVFFFCHLNDLNFSYDNVHFIITNDDVKWCFSTAKLTLFFSTIFLWRFTLKLCKVYFVLQIYSFIYSYMVRYMVSYVMQWLIICYRHYLFWCSNHASFGTESPLLTGFCVVLTCPHQSEHFLTFWHRKLSLVPTSG